MFDNFCLWERWLTLTVKEADFFFRYLLHAELFFELPCLKSAVLFFLKKSKYKTTQKKQQKTYLPPKFLNKKQTKKNWMVLMTKCQIKRKHNHAFKIFKCSCIRSNCHGSWFDVEQGKYEKLLWRTRETCGCKLFDHAIIKGQCKAQVQTHAREKPYSSIVCGTSFTLKPYLVWYVLWEKTYYCEVCISLVNTLEKTCVLQCFRFLSAEITFGDTWKNTHSSETILAKWVALHLHLSHLLKRSEY